MAGLQLVPGAVCGSNLPSERLGSAFERDSANDALSCTTTGLFTQDARQGTSLQAAGKELSGAQWHSRFPDRGDLDDLEAAFQSNVRSFIAAIEAAGGSVAIESTKRPEERAYLMHYAFKIANGSIKPNKVPARAGVDIEWDHGNDAKSIRAAQDMVNAYDIVYEPSLTSNHTRGTAIDMNISGIMGKTMKNKDDKEVKVTNNAKLWAVGATYGVKKLAKDAPHWSANGR